MVVGRDLVVGQMKEASAVQLRFAISLVGGRTKKKKKYLAVYICLLYNPPLRKLLGFDQLTHSQEQVHVELWSRTLFLALKISWKECSL
jgi:hypothetical protein